MYHISQNLNKKDGEKINYYEKNNVRAEVEFKTPKKPKNDHLVIYYFADIGMVNITDMTKDQVKESLINAAGAFETKSTLDNLNLIVVEMLHDQRQAIDFAAALYGTEYHTFKNGIRTHRDNDGLYLETDFANKIAGVAVLHRKEAFLTSPYEIAICNNPAYDFLDPIKDLIKIDKIIERYTWINGGFFQKISS
jgi:hypothetical protein